MWQQLLYYPILNLLVFFYQILFQNLGLAILAMTFVLRAVLVPLTLPTLKAAQKQKDLAPELEKLKKKHKDDKEKLAKAQMEFYRQHNVNPAAGCLPQILQLIVLIVLYQVFIQVLSNDGQAVLQLNEVLYFDFLKLDPGRTINTSFGPWNLSSPDRFFVLPILAGLAQLLLAKMMRPAAVAASEKAKKTPDKSDDLMYTMQEQMLYLMPLMTVFIGWRLPSGLVLYWLATTIFSLVQQYFVSGLGGLEPWLAKIKLK
jgi:YidC/Oxa1 family membrane protein insertase